MNYLSDTGHGLLDFGGVWHRQTGKTRRVAMASCDERLPGPLRYLPLTQATRGERQLCGVCFRRGKEL